VLWVPSKTEHRGDPKVVQQDKESESHDKLEMMLFQTNEYVNLDTAKNANVCFSFYLFLLSKLGRFVFVPVSFVLSRNRIPFRGVRKFLVALFVSV